uniref:Saposin B-type domain-containing protein n=1 Tax=Romanomermis culicivorax TaxID=13658 RepID=A0A915KH99_ROMCU
MRIRIIVILNVLFHAGFFLADLPPTEHKLRHPFIDKVECFICKLVSVEMLHIYSKSSTKDCLSTLIIDFCELLQIEELSVCSSLVHQFTDEVLYVAGQLLLKPDQFCGFILPNTCGNAYDPMHSTWNVSLPNIPKPPVQESVLPQVEKTDQKIQVFCFLELTPDAPKLRVLQLTDIHYDPLYKPETNAICDDPLCCRKVQSNLRNGISSDKFEPAGFWGTPNAKCDLPLRTLENLLQHLQKNESFDYIIWTGDLPPHNIWNQSRQGQLNAYDQLVDLFAQYFPNKTIYSVVGNHESSPVDSFPPHYDNLPQNFSISWLYNSFAKSWTKWVNQSQSSTIKRWIYLNETDPDGVLAWLVEKLQEAETVGEKVHIIGHVPPTECLSQWSLNYYRIINR